MRKTWMRACREAGLDSKIPHDFRRTAVRNMIRAGIPEQVAMVISGRKKRSVFDRYHIVSDGDLKEAAQKLDAAFAREYGHNLRHLVAAPVPTTALNPLAVVTSVHLVS